MADRNATPIVPAVTDLRAPGCTLLAVLTARARPFGPQGQTSGIFKTARTQAVYVDSSGISDDEQGDRRHHGGPEKAVHHYAFEHYAQWKEELPSSGEHFDRPGTFGENFSSLGMTETSVCVGDVFQAGSVTLEVSQARQPCWKLDLRTAVPGMAAKVQETGRTGWYYRVLNPGWVQQGDALMLLRRPNPDWPLRKLLHYLYVDRLNRDALAEMCALDCLAESWRNLAETRLRRNVVETWSSRLDIPR